MSWKKKPLYAIVPLLCTTALVSSVNAEDLADGFGELPTYSSVDTPKHVAKSFKDYTKVHYASQIRNGVTTGQQICIYSQMKTIARLSTPGDSSDNVSPEISVQLLHDDTTKQTYPQIPRDGTDDLFYGQFVAMDFTTYLNSRGALEAKSVAENDPSLLFKDPKEFYSKKAMFMVCGILMSWTDLTDQNVKKYTNQTLPKGVEQGPSLPNLSVEHFHELNSAELAQAYVNSQNSHVDDSADGWTTPDRYKRGNFYSLEDRERAYGYGRNFNETRLHELGIFNKVPDEPAPAQNP
ncbi:hypothetical protein [Endozoicomonas arenosclerae]|uniref:hypothetical protein n=1 Tax=Endozoicomonas arenosclerae TaxID=1633495 RepID=UPI000785B062|nr:hypothetical protein [Endozoicomonas arenosclerae]